jgi:hypothetical protein
MCLNDLYSYKLIRYRIEKDCNDSDEIVILLLILLRTTNFNILSKVNNQERIQKDFNFWNEYYN